MQRLIALVALGGFILSLAVHVTTLLGLDASAQLPYVWGLHLGIFSVFIPFVITSRKALGQKPTFTEIRAAFPLWIIALGFLIFAYTALNFLLFISHTEGGNPAIRAGKFILTSHGRLIREITSAEYTAFKANELRGFSGHWLLFYYIPFAYFMFKKPQAPSLDGKTNDRFLV